MKIGLVNYSLGNVGSVYSAFKFNRYDVSLISNPEELGKCDVIVLAGVGNFKTAESRLKEFKFWDKLDEEVLARKKPVLGICLGMQLFSDISYEDGENKGFGWIKGRVVKMDDHKAKIPHIGWNEITSLNNEQFFRKMRSNYYYFMHSYHFIPDDRSVVVATTKYGDMEIVSAVRKDNIVGVQFHPEKSQGDGLRFLRNFLETVS